MIYNNDRCGFWTGGTREGVTGAMRGDRTLKPNDYLGSPVE